MLSIWTILTYLSFSKDLKGCQTLFNLFILNVLSATNLKPFNGKICVKTIEIICENRKKCKVINILFFQ